MDNFEVTTLALIRQKIKSHISFQHIIRNLWIIGVVHLMKIYHSMIYKHDEDVDIGTRNYFCIVELLLINNYLEAIIKLVKFNNPLRTEFRL